MTIEWLTTNMNPPLADREIIAKNPIKPVGFRSAAKQCRIMKFRHDFSEELIIERMMEDNLALWSYTDE